MFLDINLVLKKWFGLIPIKFFEFKLIFYFLKWLGANLKSQTSLLRFL